MESAINSKDLSQTYKILMINYDLEFEINLNDDKIMIDDYEVILSDEIKYDDNPFIFKLLFGMKTCFLLKKNDKYSILIFEKLTKEFMNQFYDGHSYIFSEDKNSESH